MANETEKKSGGWVKAFLGTIAGMLSGAVVMYLTPLFDKVVKPAKPVANFAVEHDGLAVTFQNRSAGGGEGWWDFGDGSPLQPVSPQQQVVTHSYATTGDYTARLTVRNLLGEESERSVTIHLDSPKTEPPSILSLDLTPVSPGAYAPATFRATSKAKNAKLCVWDVGDEQPLEFSIDSPNEQDRLVTFWKPGGYVVKLAVVNGTQFQERSEIVYVNEPPAGTLAATLYVADEATRVESLEVAYTFHGSVPPFVNDPIYHFTEQVPARPGYEIVDVRLKTGTELSLQEKEALSLDGAALGCPAARNLQLELMPDRRMVRLSGDLDRGQIDKKAAPSLSLPAVLVEQRRSHTARPAIPVTATLTLPGSVLISLPPVPRDWVKPQRNLRFELRDGEQIVWQGSQLPASAEAAVQGHRYSFAFRSMGNQVRVDATEARPGVAAVTRP